MGPAVTRNTLISAALVALALARPGQAQQPDALNEANEQALKAAAAKVAPCIVQIETSGGAEVIGGGRAGGPAVRKGAGPTTGLILTDDGYVISSAFNFANKPAAIFV